MSRLYESLDLMTNTEINNLAKNQYSDDNIQVWIAESGNVQARYYLSENRDLCTTARDILLRGRSNLVKGILVGSGNVKDQDQIREIYIKFKNKPASSNWRIYNYFIRNMWIRGAFTNAPPDVLEDIYENRMDPQTGRQAYYSRHWVREISLHPNCSTKLAIIMSQSEQENARISGFDALVRLEKENNSL